MDMNEYQNAAARTARSYQDPKLGALVSTLGLSGEAAEVMDLLVQTLSSLLAPAALVSEVGHVTEMLKKVHGHSHPLDRDKLIKELGDVQWYIADVARRNGITLAEVGAENIRKLTGRYPDGFAVERSINREEEK